MRWWAVVLMTGWAYPGFSQVKIYGMKGYGKIDQGNANTASPMTVGSVLPATCDVGDVHFRTSASAGANLYFCTAANTWTQMASGGNSGGVPSGTVTLITSGACGSGWDEAVDLAGVTLVGTLAVNGDVGSTGGSDSITPAGSVGTPVFTGNQVTSSAVSGGTPSGTNSVPLFTGSALSTHSHGVGSFTNSSDSAGTPVGTVGAPVFTGSSGAVPAQTISWPAGVPVASGGAVDAHSGTAVANHASHTHTYTDVLNHTHTITITDPGHTHTQSVNSATTGGSSGYTPDTSTNSTSTSGYSTLSATTGITASSANPGGGVASGTTAGPSAALTHSVTQPANHVFTQPSIAWPAGVPVNGSVNFTPAGTNSAPVFTGSVLGTHTHGLSGTSGTASAGTPAGTVSAPAFTGDALGAHSHTVTATGSVSQPAFNGNAFDNRSAFVKVIFCRKQ